ncbi:hypothetical protein NIES4071_99250 [Calothrix sp. NIES-4071]|nr:hypothetical protein NIES4071_99250 [Calothrix sp. NIES-4071]BAZ64188.1 hypothetical protein NIES4105_99180 [Calothrix sp. NIES-4105]
MNTSAQQDSFKVFLSYSAHNIAKQRSQGISNAEATKRVYLNSLATYAVDYYLNCMSFETVKDKESNQNPWMQSLINTADVEVKNIGKLECLPVSPNTKYCLIPQELASDRVAYIFVEINSKLDEAHIIGFIPNVTVQAPIALNQLQSVDSLLEYLTEKEQAAIVNISEWMKGFITEGWQNLENIFNPQQLVFVRSARFNITQAKKIDLGLQLDSTPIALVAKVSSENEDTIKMTIQACPLEGTYLPKGLELIVNDENGESVLNATSRDNDNWVEVTLSAQVGEKFSVDVCLAESKVTQQFIV